MVEFIYMSVMRDLALPAEVLWECISFVARKPKRRGENGE
jgi:hypothetical protein